MMKPNERLRIVVDLDGVLCPIRREEEAYGDLEPVLGAVEAIERLRAAGHYIIIQTARNMATQESNVGRVLKNIGKVTLDWLEQHGIDYDEIHFGKPNAHIYIDDRAVRFEDWTKLTNERVRDLARAK